MQNEVYTAVYYVRFCLTEEDKSIREAKYVYPVAPIIPRIDEIYVDSEKENIYKVSKITHDYLFSKENKKLEHTICVYASCE